MCKFVNSVGVTLNILKADKRAMPLMLAFPQEMVVLLLRLLLWSKDDCFVDTTRIPYCRFPQIQNPDRRLTLYECVTRIAMNYFFFVVLLSQEIYMDLCSVSVSHLIIAWTVNRSNDTFIVAILIHDLFAHWSYNERKKPLCQ